ncbi:MAG: hypothetical protein MUP70_11600 [Candidatus Aminicenantes bacterium]|nr:hypothetical protein [Candidatus Aminicenantes bacterium]
MIWNKDKHGISKKDIDPEAAKVIHRLSSQGFTAYLTGATVQNLMQGIKPKDFDIVTDARPGQIKRRFSNSFLIGRRFRLAHIHFKDGKIIEVATFRRMADAVVDSRDASNIGDKRRETYGTPAEDSFRRDISINALFYDVRSDTVIDYVDGLKDFTEKRIRIIGNPAQKFKEDPVRMMRVVRHAARLDFIIDKKTEKSLRLLIPLLKESSSARLYEELNKDLMLKTRIAFEAYARYGMLGHFLGEVGEEYQTDQKLFSRLIFVLAAKDRAACKGEPFSLEELYALLFWPWMDKHFSQAKEDPQKELLDAVQKAFTCVTVPRKIRADFIQILLLLRNMKTAMQTGQMRSSWQRRPLYGSASRLAYLIQEGYLPGKGRSFESLFMSRHGKNRPTAKKKLTEKR